MRGAEGTTPTAHTAGTQIYHVLTAGALAQVTPASFANALQAQNNLSDVSNAASARSNLGLGTAAVSNTSSFDPAGAAASAVAVETSRALTAEALAEQLAHKNQPGGYPGLDGSGFIPTSAIPAINLTQPFVVASQTDMLALSSAVVGAVAIRTDVNETFILGSLPPATLGNWIQLPTSVSVQSVNGLTGAVTLTAADVGADVAGAAATAQATAQSSSLQRSNNLSDLSNVTTARTNLGLGSAATQNTSAFDSNGAAASAQAASLQKTSNLSDLNNAGTARTNLGLGSSATHASTDFDTAGAAAIAQSAAVAASLPVTTTLDAVPGAANDVDLHTHRLIHVGDAQAATDALNRETGDVRYDLAGSASAAAALSVPLNTVGQPNGVAGLDSSGHVPSSQISVASRVFVQDSAPSPTSGFGEYIWFDMDGSGNLNDIVTGIA